MTDEKLKPGNKLYNDVLGAIFLNFDSEVETVNKVVDLVTAWNRRSQGWRTDLDAAPENTPIMLSDGDWVAEGYCLSDGSERDGTFWQANDSWTDAHDAQLLPTHWMPMPTPPTPVAESGE